MGKMKKQMGTLALLISFLTVTSSLAATRQWSPEKAARWSAANGWTVGSNYTPASASNSIEMWREETFDPARIDRELGWAASLGMKSMRVFLHDLAWEEDPRGFIERLDVFLNIADHHGIQTMIVFFDSVWNPEPEAGPQSGPRRGVHNSRWVQSPGLRALMDPSEYPRLETYVKSVVDAFADDPRIHSWDVWNEPDNLNIGSYDDPEEKLEYVERLLPEVFRWIRAMDPIQPLTSGVWKGNWTSDGTLTPIERLQLDLSDVISFHHYGVPEDFERRIRDLSRYGRPIFCTEYMARPLGSEFATILPVARDYGVGAYNWGFVAGRTQTYFPWDSWEKPYRDREPPVWFHDIFYSDGTPYRVEETEFIRKILVDEKAARRVRRASAAILR
jgi:hypothetical protein